MANEKHVAHLKEGVEAWNQWRDGNRNIRPDLMDMDFTDREAFAETNIWSERFDRVAMMRANLKNVRFDRSNLTRVYFTGADLRGASVRGCNLTKTNFHQADLTRVDFSFALFNDNNVSDIVYRRSKLRGKCQGVRGVSTIFGNAIFQRDLQDQDYIDTRWSIAKGSLLREMPLVLWSLFDYGRSWLRVAIFAVAAIALFGCGYSLLDGLGSITYTENAGSDNPWRPWYCAGMGFATLGLTDVIAPLDEIGQLWMMGNVLSGFVTLGLLLAVLSTKFARRS